jgi:hypothetical protein
MRNPARMHSARAVTICFVLFFGADQTLIPLLSFYLSSLSPFSHLIPFPRVSRWQRLQISPCRRQTLQCPSWPMTLYAGIRRNVVETDLSGRIKQPTPMSWSRATILSIPPTSFLSSAGTSTVSLLVVLNIVANARAGLGDGYRRWYQYS